MATAGQRKQADRYFEAMLEQLSWPGCSTEQRPVVDHGHRIERTPTLDEYDGTEEEML